MGDSERKDFVAWYEDQKSASAVFDNRRVLEQYCQDDVTVLRQACQAFRREFKEIGRTDVYQESITIASACNKVFRKLFLQPDTIGLIPTGGYTGNVRYSKKALMWLAYREHIDGCKILHGRNGGEYRLPELPHLSVDGICPETKKVYEFLGCYFHGHTCLPFRDVTTMVDDTLSARYEQTISRLAQITQAGYEVVVQWEWAFDRDILPSHPKLKRIR
jgi:hypothetical protein